MPVWLAATLAVLGLAVSAVALTVSILAFRRAGPLTEMQTRLAALELAAKKRAQLAQTKAEIRAFLFDAGRFAHRLALENVGGAAATDVDIEFLEEKGQELFPQGVREENLPVRRLAPNDRVTLLAALVHGRYPPFAIALSWIDPDGTPQRFEETLRLRE